MADQGGTPPGWYPDGQGNNRWWDGSAWGPIQTAAPAAAAPQPVVHQQHGMPANAGQASYIDPVAQGKTAATWLHIIPIVAVVLYFTTDNPFVKKHAQEAFNFALSAAAVFIGGWIVAGILIAVGFAIAGGLGALLLVVAWLAWLVAVVFAIIWEIKGAIAANAGQEYLYPYNFRWIKG